MLKNYKHVQKNLTIRKKNCVVGKYNIKGIFLNDSTALIYNTYCELMFFLSYLLYINSLAVGAIGNYFLKMAIIFS